MLFLHLQTTCWTERLIALLYTSAFYVTTLTIYVKFKIERFVVNANAASHLSECFGSL